MRIAVVWFIGFQLLALFGSTARRAQRSARAMSTDAASRLGHPRRGFPVSRHWRAYDVPCLRPTGC